MDYRTLRDKLNEIPELWLDEEVVVVDSYGHNRMKCKLDVDDAINLVIRMIGIDTSPFKGPRPNSPNDDDPLAWAA